LIESGHAQSAPVNFPLEKFCHNDRYDRSRQSRPDPFASWAAVFVALICAAILALSGEREWDAREIVLKTAEVDMENLARSLTQHAEDSFDLLDASIIGVVTRLELDGTGPVTLSTLQKVIEARKAGLKHIHDLVICDERGNWLMASGAPGPDLSGHEFFRHHMQSDVRDAFMGHPFKSSTSGEWITTLFRRFNRPGPAGDRPSPAIASPTTQGRGEESVRSLSFAGTTS
jgi:hypothetical protein